jgi:hypothetical protein
VTLHGRAQAIPEISPGPAGEACTPGPAKAPSAGGIAQLTGAAASLTRKVITPAIASGYHVALLDQAIGGPVLHEAGKRSSPDHGDSPHRDDAGRDVTATARA